MVLLPGGHLCILVHALEDIHVVLVDVLLLVLGGADRGRVPGKESLR